MYKKYLLFLILFIASTKTIAENYVFEFNDNCNSAYQNFMSLNIDEAKIELSKEIKSKPNNLISLFLADYEDYILLSINCDKDLYNKNKNNLNDRIDALNKGDENSPWFRFCKAGIYLHWTIINLRFGEEYKAATLIRKSYLLLKENERLFPNFEYNQIYEGLEEAVIGSLPSNYKWIANAFGMKGSVKNGTDKLAIFVKTHNEKQPLYVETKLYYLYTKFYLLNQQAQTWDYLCSSQFVVTGNLLNMYIKTYIGNDFHKAENVIEIIKAASKEKKISQYPSFDFQMGIAFLYSLNKDCIPYFQKFINTSKCELHKKDAWLKMCYYWYINNNMQMANYCRQQIKNYGNTQLDVDKQAQKFATEEYWPVSSLLQARLLLEGGAYMQAYTILKDIIVKNITNEGDKTEYFYRLGIVYEQAEDFKNAIQYFNYAIKNGKDRKEQYAARACLHLGFYYENKLLKTQAISAYKEAIDMPEHDFQNSINQQAKAGLSRLE